jgi:hypothetical protein
MALLNHYHSSILSAVRRASVPDFDGWYLGDTHRQDLADEKSPEDGDCQGAFMQHL